MSEQTLISPGTDNNPSPHTIRKTNSRNTFAEWRTERRAHPCPRRDGGPDPLADSGGSGGLTPDTLTVWMTHPGTPSVTVGGTPGTLLAAGGAGTDPRSAWSAVSFACVRDLPEPHRTRAGPASVPRVGNTAKTPDPALTSAGRRPQATPNFATERERSQSTHAPRGACWESGRSGDTGRRLPGFPPLRSTAPPVVALVLQASKPGAGR